MDLVSSQLLFLSAVEIEGFHTCMPLGGYNRPLKAGFANWM